MLTFRFVCYYNHYAIAEPISMKFGVIDYDLD